MSDLSISRPPHALRAAIAADLSPVGRLRTPFLRALWLAPLAGVLLVAAPLIFDFRDLRPLGWIWSWGASLVQLVAGLGLAAAALRESVPGRSWSRGALVSLVTVPVLMVVAVTLGSWHASPVLVQGSWLFIATICFACTTASALPATALASVLALRAFPTRPGLTGCLAGLAGGLMADAGWRLFCHFSEPAHVVAAHLGGVITAGLIGAVLTRWLSAKNYAD